MRGLSSAHKHKCDASMSSGRGVGAHRRAQPVIGQVDLQAEVDAEKGLGELLNGGGICKVQLVLGPESAS